jgi:hypothetical protein
VISIDDIVSYEEGSHEIELTFEAFAGIVKLEVPVNGMAFVATLDRRPVRWGAFWTPVSSTPFDGVAIVKPLTVGERIIHVQLGYASSVEFTGSDPRAWRRWTGRASSSSPGPLGCNTHIFRDLSAIQKHPSRHAESDRVRPAPDAGQRVQAGYSNGITWGESPG